MFRTKIGIEEKKAYKDKLRQFVKLSEEDKFKVISEDPSLFSYGVLRNRKMARMMLYAFQDLIINDTSKLIAVAISRQTGKSTMAVIKALHYILNNDNATVLVISKTLKQSMELIAKLKGLIANSPLKDEINQLATGFDNKSEFYIKNKDKETYSRIISVPATDSARGFTADLVIADEIAFWDNSEEMFNEAILPTISETNGTIMMLSTPKGKIGVFYKAFEKSDIWSCYQFDWKICPHHTLERMDIFREQIGEFAFRQEYEASFEANQAAYFKMAHIKRAIDEDFVCGGITNFPLVVGVDFGKKHDNTIITLGYIENPDDFDEFHRIRIFDIIEKPLNTDYNNIVGELKALSKKYNIQNILYDATGVGEGPGDFMKDIGLPVEGIIFSIQSKLNIFSNLNILFEDKKGIIKIPNNKRLIDELLLFEYEYTTSGNMKLHHPLGGHDDMCDSLALCCYGLIRTDFVEPSFEVI